MMSDGIRCCCANTVPNDSRPMPVIDQLGARSPAHSATNGSIVVDTVHSSTAHGRRFSHGIDVADSRIAHSMIGVTMNGPSSRENNSAVNVWPVSVTAIGTPMRELRYVTAT